MKTAEGFIKQMGYPQNTQVNHINIIHDMTFTVGSAALENAGHFHEKNIYTVDE